MMLEISNIEKKIIQAKRMKDSTERINGLAESERNGKKYTISKDGYFSTTFSLEESNAITSVIDSILSKRLKDYKEVADELNLVSKLLK